MNIRDLEYLVSVASLCHFRKAAEQCHVSQPTLSTQLKKLEQELGLQLFERNQRQVLVTQAGREVVKRAKRILAEVSELVVFGQTYGDPMRGKIKLGLIPTLAPYLLPKILDPIKRRFPDLEMVLLEAQTEVLVSWLEEGSLDLAILALPAGGERFTDIFLFEEKFFLALQPDHPLAKKEYALLEDLNWERIMLLADGHCLRDQALDLCYSAGAKAAEAFRATGLETLRHMVAAGNGMTLIPQLAVPPEGRQGGVRYLPFREPAPGRQIGLLFRSGTSRLECFRNLAKVIKAQTLF